MGVSLSRQGGGIGTRGPGETKLETDRRHIRERISRLEDELEQVRKVRAVQRERRMKNAIPVVAIGGIHRGNIASLAGTDIRGVAVVSGIFAAEDIERECRVLRAEISKIVK